MGGLIHPLLFYLRLVYNFGMNFLENIWHIGRGKLSPRTCRLKPIRGFTLVEMMVVIAIIGIVSGIVMASISNAKAKGRDSDRIADISVIQLALERYYDDPTNKRYPANLSTLKSYDNSVPTEDLSGSNYLFVALNSNNTAACLPPSPPSTCQSYHLGTALELDNAILDDDVDLNSSALGGFNGADSFSPFVYDVIPKF